MASSLSIAVTSSKGPSSTGPAFFAAALEAALARYLELDPDSPRLLAPLAGKTIALVIEPFDTVIYLAPSEDHVPVLLDAPENTDLTLRGSIAAFARLALATDPHAELFSGRVQVSGDTKTARAFQNLFQRLDIDWEEHASHLIGDYLAHRMGNVFRVGRQWLQETHHTLRLNLAEYLQEESRDLPAPPETDGFCNAVDRLRADADRLEARVARLTTVVGG